MGALTRRQLLCAGVSTAGLALVATGCGLSFAARPTVARVGFLGISRTNPPHNQAIFDAFIEGLRDAGWVEGQNLVIDQRLSGDHPEHLPGLAAELVALKPDVLFGGSDEIVRALIQASNTIPIVFAAVIDPVGSGLVASLRPGGNVTGTSRSAGQPQGTKVLDLLRQILPGLSRVAVLFESASRTGETDAAAISAAAQSLGVDARAVAIASADDIPVTLDTVLASRPHALILNAGATIITPNLTRIIEYALTQGVPSASELQVARYGGLLTYGGDDVTAWRRAGAYYVDRILRGAKPADLPIEQPTVFDLLINRTTAKTLGITIPPEIAAQVTEWID